MVLLITIPMTFYKNAITIQLIRKMANIFLIFLISRFGSTHIALKNATIKGLC